MYFMKKQHGFTLVEMMVVVLIIAILAAIAYPSYQRYVRNARLQNARADLMVVKNTLEKYYVQNHSFRRGNAYPNNVLNSVNNQFFNIGFYGNDEAGNANLGSLTCNPANAPADQYCLYAVARNNNAGETRFLFTDASASIQVCDTAAATIENNILVNNKLNANCTAE